MKHNDLLILLAGGIFTTASQAAVLTPQQAYQAAVSQGKGAAVMQKAGTSQDIVPLLTVKADNQPAVYLFSNEGGSMVASAESDSPALLGYTDRPVASVEEIPDGLGYWLDYYAKEIKQLRDGNVMRRVSEASAQDYATVEPFVTTRWNQSSPYYNMCPTLNNQRCVTGCVATAMAQAVKYYNWPEQGKGSISYQWTYGGQTLSADFSESTYQWELMPDDFYGDNTKDQQRAVALINKDLGYSVQMNYSPSASGAYDIHIAGALYDYFSYDKSMRYEQRCNFYTEDWTALVYDDVAARRPVIYCGQGEAGGHCFICDGYGGDGYFHFNWGWGGTSDGYFKLSALAPGIQGIGGNNGNFNSMQSIIHGLKPAEAGSKLGVVLSADTGLTAGKSQYTSGTVKMGCSDINNYSVEAVTGYFGVKLIPQSGGDPIYVQGSEQVTLTTVLGSNYYSSGFRIPFANFPTSGAYTCEPAFYMDGEWIDVETSKTYPWGLDCTIEDGVISFQETTAPAELEIENFQLTSALYSGVPFSVSYDASNPGTEDFYGDMRIALLTDEYKLVSYSSVFTIGVESGEESTQTHVTEFVTTVTPGDYLLALISQYGLVYATQNVTVGTAPAETAAVSLSNLTVSNPLSVGEDSSGHTTYKVDPNDITVTGTMTCTAGYLYDPVYAYFFPAGGGSSLGMLGSAFNLLNAGSSANFSINGQFSTSADQVEYLIGFFCSSKQIANAYLYIVCDKSSGVKAVQAERLNYSIDGDMLHVGGDLEGKSITRIYSVDGTLMAESTDKTIDLSGIGSGVYIVTLTDGSKVYAAKIMR